MWAAAVRCLLIFSSALAAVDAQTPSRAVMVATPSVRHAVFGAGGTLALMAAEGRPVHLVVFGNDEKESVGLAPAQSREVGEKEARRAAAILGIEEVLYLGHKSGELGHVSSSEMRNQVMALTRLYKPEILFFPDWYVHYQDDNDLYRVGRMAEESPYGGSSLFLQEMTYLGFPGAAARQYYFFVPFRPYREREGGEVSAVMKQVDISGVMEKKLEAATVFATANAAWAARVRSTAPVDRFVRGFLEELAATVGARHKLRFAEEFNHLRREGGLPAHVMEKAKRK